MIEPRCSFNGAKHGNKLYVCGGETAEGEEEDEEDGAATLGSMEVTHRHLLLLLLHLMHLLPLLLQPVPVCGCRQCWCAGAASIGVWVPPVPHVYL